MGPIQQPSPVVAGLPDAVPIDDHLDPDRTSWARWPAHDPSPPAPSHRLSLPARDVGPLVIGLLVVGLAVLWAVGIPAGQPVGSYVGQLMGAESVLLMSVAIVLISTLPWVEEWFDGIDRAAIWHRRTAMIGIVLLLPHILLSTNPHGAGIGGTLGIVGLIGLIALIVWAILPRWRSILPQPVQRPILAIGRLGALRVVNRWLGGYERWRSLHRLTGLFVAIGFIHGLMNGTAFGAAPALRWSYVAIGAIGLTVYGYRELLARRFWPMHDYQVESSRPLAPGLLEIALTPVGRPLRFVPGQFAMVFLEARDGWHRHPFTISSGSGEDVLRVTVKALGDYTSALEDLVDPGMPAVIGGPHGRFDLRRGTVRQVWIAAGVGVAPFLSWIRSLGDDLPFEVDFFYTAAGPIPFSDEITEIAARHPSLRVHLIDSVSEGRLSSQHVLQQLAGDVTDLSLYMCGPEPLLRRFALDLRRAGVRRTRIHREYFDWR